MTVVPTPRSRAARPREDSHSARRAGRFACTLALLACLVGRASLAQQQDQDVTPNFRDTDIRQVIEAVQAVTGSSFVVDPRINAQVTLLSSSPMSPDAFYETFLSILEVYNFAAVDRGDVIMIVPDADVRQRAGNEDGAQNFVTQTMVLENVGASQIVPLLRPMMATQSAHLGAHQSSNMLILFDREENVQRMMRIVARMDQAGTEDVEVIPLENASATEVVRMLSTLSQTQEAAGGAPTVQVIADQRTNSVLLSGTGNGRLRYRMLIAHLDSPTEESGESQVRYLRYADAEDLATKLQTQFGAAGTGPGAGGEGAPTPGAAVGEGGVSIWSDQGTNALVINAPAPVMADINAVIDRIDIRRAQVQVDAIIVEVGEEKEAQLGITFAAEGVSSNNPLALTNLGSGGIIGLATAAGGETPDPSAIPQGVTVGVGRVSDSDTSWAALLTALRGDADTNVVSTPTIVTLDNEEAEIRVGQEVPFLTGQFTNTGANQGSVNPFQTISREEVGTSLQITPKINRGSGVTLQITQEQSSISAGAAGAVDLVTNSRTITTSVFVDDGDILVLGGLIDDQLRESEQRVPVLGKIPGLGWLFRSRTTDRVKTNLMVFIRPRILRDSMDARFETNAKYNYMREEQLRQDEGPVQLMRDETRPRLEPLPPLPETIPPVAVPDDAQEANGEQGAGNERNAQGDDGG